MKSQNDVLLDMKGKKIEFGHIVAVRYTWNSYVGVARMKGFIRFQIASSDRREEKI